MGKDGYFLHVAGHGTTIYYARTNSTHWFKVGALSLNSATPQAFKTVSDNSFDFNKYVPGFLTAGNVATVYTTVNDAATQTGKTYTLKNIYKKMLVQRNNGGKWNTLKINYDGKILYYVNSDGVIRPYNTYRDADPFDSTIDSPYSPNSYSKIYMKNGNHIYNGTHWDKVVTYGNGGNSVFVTQSYICKNGHWFKTK